MEGFDKVAEPSEIQPGTIKISKVGGADVMVANIGGAYFALPNKCTHQGGPIGRGKLTGSVVQCPWHGSKFDVTTGAVVGGPAKNPEPELQVSVDPTGIYVKKP